MRSIVIGWDESLAEVLSRRRLGAISVYCCVTSIKIGREKEDQQVLQVLRCFTTVRGQIRAENCERYWMGGQSEERDKQDLFPQEVYNLKVREAGKMRKTTSMI